MCLHVQMSVFTALCAMYLIDGNMLYMHTLVHILTSSGMSEILCVCEIISYISLYLFFLFSFPLKDFDDLFKQIK